MNYYLDGFTKRESEFIHDVLSDKRGWAGLKYTFTLVRIPGQLKSSDVYMRKRPQSELIKRFKHRPDLKGFSVTDTSASPTEIWINKENWNTVPKDFIGDIQSYRCYLIQHEMGHALGYGHDQPHHGGPCPVMYQQTRGTRNKCTVNPWKTLETEHIKHNQGAKKSTIL